MVLGQALEINDTENESLHAIETKTRAARFAQSRACQLILDQFKPEFSDRHTIKSTLVEPHARKLLLHTFILIFFSRDYWKGVRELPLLACLIYSRHRWN